MEKKKVLLIVNPTSGKNKSRAGTFDIVEKFSSADYDFTVKATTCQGDATNIVKKYIDGNDLVVCCGGDGTFNETINGVMSLSRRVPIGYIPAGSTNDLANTIGIPLDIKEATDAIIRGKTNQYDIGLFNNRFFSYIASFGAATNLSYNTPQKLKNLFGHNAYLINGLVLNLPRTLLTIKPIHIKIEYDGKYIEDDFYFGSISNSTSVAGIFKFDRNDVRLDDGKFEVLLVRGLKSPLESFGLLSQIKKMHYDGKKIIYLKCSNIKMTFDKEIPWTLDGEFGGNQKEVRFSVLNRAIDIISGPNSLFTGDSLDIEAYDPAAANKTDDDSEEQEKRFKFLRRKKDQEETEESPAEETSEKAEEAPETDAEDAKDESAEKDESEQEKRFRFQLRKKDQENKEEDNDQEQTEDTGASSSEENDISESEE